MIYPKDFENKIGFKQIRELIADKCESEKAAQFALDFKFSSDFNFLIKELGATNEMKQLIKSGETLPLFHFFDTAKALKENRAPGAFISSENLYLSALAFLTMEEIYSFFNHSESGIDTKYLKQKFKDIPTFEELKKEILKCIDKDGFVKDNASPQLYEIRKEIEGLSRSMHKIMRRVLDSSASQGIIEKDTSPVLREGRLVLPVSATQKKNIPGIVHDISATGKTVFIEPAEVVEAGNRIRELRNQEEQEIIRILISLTDSLRPFENEINRACDLLIKYDFIKAKAIFATIVNGELPVIEKETEIDWYHAIHPGLLLTLQAQGKEAVAMNLKLDGEQRILMISGPNAGGKSVALKTVATLQYMMQCGILPSLYSNSHMGIFSSIFIDIGDEQSMENDLSTYSSHLANMKFFIQNVNDHTLILADEMGSGTEPQIGAALAQSILKKLGESGCFGIITTHYQNLKIFAENEPGFVNGAMMYDRQHLRPTFQLSVGEPGSSFALDIARNIGLPLEVIESAKEIVGSEYVDAERFMLDIQRDKRYWKNKRLEIKEKENKLNRLLEEYEEKAENLKTQRSAILKEAKQEAKEIIKGANTQIERSIHEIRKAQAEREKSKEIRQELENYKKSLEKDSDNLTTPEILKPLKHKSKRKKTDDVYKSSQEIQKELSVGDYVKLIEGGVSGQIINIEGKKAEVAFGNLRTKVELNKLQLTKKPVTKNNSIVFSSQANDTSGRERQLNFKNEIDVRGFRADEAIQAIIYFIDDAIQFNAHRVRILHGTGHGILRSLIRQQLQGIPSVKDFHDEDVRFGGAGITVVDLD